jgi:holliday junction DNA helicase RuvA
MIGFINGKIISLKPTKVLIDVNGVGYIINISINTFEKISGKENASLFIHTSVKEDSISLFGFYTESEKEMFELLISVSGIGPKLAIYLLSGIQTDDLKNAIRSSDISRIITVPGIGRKTAERLLLELKTKVDQVSGENDNSISHKIKNEAVSALTTLGYNNKFTDKIVRDILLKDSSISLEELIKKSLGELSK